jgi:hypothetical protein
MEAAFYSETFEHIYDLYGGISQKIMILVAQLIKELPIFSPIRKLITVFTKTSSPQGRSNEYGCRTRLHGATSQQIVIFIVTAVRTSNLTYVVA